MQVLLHQEKEKPFGEECVDVSSWLTSFNSGNPFLTLQTQGDKLAPAAVFMQGGLLRRFGGAWHELRTAESRAPLPGVYFQPVAWNMSNAGRQYSADKVSIRKKIMGPCLTAPR